MDGKVEKQEVKANEVLKEVKEEYDKVIVNLEDNTNTQLKVAEELKKELKNHDFDANIEELKSLREEILGLKSEIKREYYIYFSYCKRHKKYRKYTGKSSK